MFDEEVNDRYVPHDELNKHVNSKINEFLEENGSSKKHRDSFDECTPLKPTFETPATENPNFETPIKPDFTPHGGTFETPVKRKFGSISQESCRVRKNRTAQLATSFTGLAILVMIFLTVFFGWMEAVGPVLSETLKNNGSEEKKVWKTAAGIEEEIEGRKSSNTFARFSSDHDIPGSKSDLEISEAEKTVDFSDFTTVSVKKSPLVDACLLTVKVCFSQVPVKLSLTFSGRNYDFEIKTNEFHIGLEPFQKITHCSYKTIFSRVDIDFSEKVLEDKLSGVNAKISVGYLETGECDSMLSGSPESRAESKHESKLESEFSGDSDTQPDSENWSDYWNIDQLSTQNRSPARIENNPQNHFRTINPEEWLNENDRDAFGTRYVMEESAVLKKYDNFENAKKSDFLLTKSIDTIVIPDLYSQPETDSVDLLSLLDDSTIPDIPYLITLKNPVNFLENDIGKISFWFLPTFYQEVCVGFLENTPENSNNLLDKLGSNQELGLQCSKTQENSKRLVEETVTGFWEKIPWYFDYSTKFEKTGDYTAIMVVRKIQGGIEKEMLVEYLKSTLRVENENELNVDRNIMNLELLWPEFDKKKMEGLILYHENKEFIIFQGLGKGISRIAASQDSKNKVAFDNSDLNCKITENIDVSKKPDINCQNWNSITVNPDKTKQPCGISDLTSCTFCQLPHLMNHGHHTHSEPKRSKLRDGSGVHSSKFSKNNETTCQGCVKYGLDTNERSDLFEAGKMFSYHNKATASACKSCAKNTVVGHSGACKSQQLLNNLTDYDCYDTTVKQNCDVENPLRNSEICQSTFLVHNKKMAHLLIPEHDDNLKNLYLSGNSKLEIDCSNTLRTHKQICLKMVETWSNFIEKQDPATNGKVTLPVVYGTDEFESLYSLLKYPRNYMAIRKAFSSTTCKRCAWSLGILPTPGDHCDANGNGYLNFLDGMKNWERIGNDELQYGIVAMNTRFGDSFFDYQRFYSNVFKPKDRNPTNQETNIPETNVCKLEIEVFFPGLLSNMLRNSIPGTPTTWKPREKFFDVYRRFNVFFDRLDSDGNYKRELLYSKYGKISPCWKTLELDFGLKSKEKGQIIIDAQVKEVDHERRSYFADQGEAKPWLFDVEGWQGPSLHYIALRRIEFKGCQLEVIEKTKD